MSDPGYAQKRAFFDRCLTVFGRKPVLEALLDEALPLFRLHLARSNQQQGIIGEIIERAAQRGCEIVYHERAELARISRNGRQDQGVALDIQCPGFSDFNTFVSQPPERFELIALDRITNPQNLGMIIRSVCASPSHGLLLPRRGCAKIDGLVIKASAGSVFRARIIFCDQLHPALQALRGEHQTLVASLAADAGQTLGSFQPPARCVYVLGNETEGVGAELEALADRKLSIPMAGGVESLNVAVAAALVAFRSMYDAAATAGVPQAD